MRSLFIVLALLILMSSLSVEAETPSVFEKIELDVKGKKILVLWQRLGVPDAIIRYCGLNYIYFNPTLKWWDQVIVEWNISRYVGLPPWFKPDDAESEAKLNSEKLATLNEIEEAFERAGAREHGWYGMVYLGYYFEWEPKILGIYAYLGGVEVPREAKINRIEALLNRVLGVLEKYNATIVMIIEVDSMIELKKVFPAGYALGRALNEARSGSEVPDVVRRYIAEGTWNAGNSLGSVSIAFDLPPPSMEDLEVLVKWIRDRMGHCEVPLVIGFNVPVPGAEDIELLPLIIENESAESPPMVAEEPSTSEPNTTMYETMIGERLGSVLVLAVIALISIAIGLLAGRRTV